MPTKSPAAIAPPDLRIEPPTARPLRRPQTLTPALRVRRAVALLVISLVVPGSAQIAAGNRRAGRGLLRVWLALVALAVILGVLALLDRRLLLSMATSPIVLTGFAVLAFVWAVVMPIVLGDAWRLGRVGTLPGRAPIWVSALAAVLMVATSGALIGTGSRLWAGADAISGIFGSGRTSSATDGRFNVLLLGGDAGADRVGTRPDSMTLASIDSRTGRTVLFSLPRNLEDIPFAPGSPAAKALPQGWSCGDQCLLNSIYTWGTAHRSLFPGVADPGAEAMKEAVEGITGLRVNYYVLIDLRGFSSLIDAMGGVTVTVHQRVPIGGETSRVSGYIEPGTQHLDGYHALWFARSRHGASDYARMARQRCVMDAMVHQLDPTTVLAKFQGIAAASKNVMSTDIPGGELATFLDLAAKAKSQKISSVQFVPPLINPARPDFGVVRSKVVTAIDTSRKAPSSTAPSSTAPSASGSAPTPVSTAGASHQATSRAAGASASPAASPAAEASDISAICSPA